MKGLRRSEQSGPGWQTTKFSLKQWNILYGLARLARGVLIVFTVWENNPNLSSPSKIRHVAFAVSLIQIYRTTKQSHNKPASKTYKIKGNTHPHSDKITRVGRDRWGYAPEKIISRQCCSFRDSLQVSELWENKASVRFPRAEATLR